MKGSAKRRRGKTAYVEVRMTPALRASIEAAAGAEDSTKSEWVREACVQRLSREAR